MKTCIQSEHWELSCLTVNFSSTRHPVTFTAGQMTETKDTLDCGRHHAANRACPGEIPYRRPNQQHSNTCAPKLHKTNAFSAPKRHLPPQQVLTGNALGVHPGQERLLATINNTAYAALSPFDPSKIRPHSSKTHNTIYFSSTQAFEHACCIDLWHSRQA